MNMSKTTKFLIVGETPSRTAIVRDGLQCIEQCSVDLISDFGGLLRRIAVIGPDVVIFDLADVEQAQLLTILKIARELKRPVVMFVNESDSAMTAAAVEAGVSAYIIDGLKKERVKPIVEMAVSRFELFSKLEAELEDTREALNQRKNIDRAKGILMKRHGLTEEEAYTKIRNTAMNQNRKIAAVAASLISAAELLT